MQNKPTLEFLFQDNTDFMKKSVIITLYEHLHLFQAPVINTK